jgi:hypothetical protein
MSDRSLVRLAAIAAIAGGLLRIANCFTGAWLGERALGLIYFGEDLLLMAGLLGLWLPSRRELGIAGVVGFALGVVGLLTIRSLSLFGAWGYQIGAAELLVGLALIGLSRLRAGERLVPSLFMAALALGLASLAPPLAKVGALAAAIAFGLGFALAGVRLLQSLGIR